MKDLNKRLTADVDAHVGNSVRLRRTTVGMSQAQLGEAIGLSFQQVQKYEKGANRIGAGKLLQIANALNVPVSFFYEGLISDDDDDNFRLMSRANLETVRDLTSMPEENAKRLRAIVKSVAKACAEAGAV